MLPITDAQVKEWGGVEYDTLIDSFQCSVLVQAHDDNWQGDSWYLLRDPATGQYGFLTFGWGSCSGCDAAQAVETVEEAIALRDLLAGGIHWEPNAALMKLWLTVRDWSLEFYGFSSTFHKKFLPAAIAAVTKETEGH